MALIPKDSIWDKEKRQAAEYARLSEREIWRGLVIEMVGDAPFWVRPWLSRYVREKGMLQCRP